MIRSLYNKVLSTLGEGYNELVEELLLYMADIMYRPKDIIVTGQLTSKGNPAFLTSHISYADVPWFRDNPIWVLGPAASYLDTVTSVTKLGNNIYVVPSGILLRSSSLRNSYIELIDKGISWGIKSLLDNKLNDSAVSILTYFAYLYGKGFVVNTGFPQATSPQSGTYILDSGECHYYKDDSLYYQAITGFYPGFQGELSGTVSNGGTPTPVTLQVFNNPKGLIVQDSLSGFFSGTAVSANVVFNALERSIISISSRPFGTLFTLSCQMNWLGKSVTITDWFQSASDFANWLISSPYNGMIYLAEAATTNSATLYFYGQYTDSEATPVISGVDEAATTLVTIPKESCIFKGKVKHRNPLDTDFIRDTSYSNYAYLRTILGGIPKTSLATKTPGDYNLEIVYQRNPWASFNGTISNILSIEFDSGYLITSPSNSKWYDENKLLSINGTTVYKSIHQWAIDEGLDPIEVDSTMLTISNPALLCYTRKALPTVVGGYSTLIIEDLSKNPQVLLVLPEYIKTKFTPKLISGYAILLYTSSSSFSCVVTGGYAEPASVAEGHTLTQVSIGSDEYISSSFPLYTTKLSALECGGVIEPLMDGEAFYRQFITFYGKSSTNHTPSFNQLNEVFSTSVDSISGNDLNLYIDGSNHYSVLDNSGNGVTLFSQDGYHVLIRPRSTENKLYVALIKYDSSGLDTTNLVSSSVNPPFNKTLGWNKYDPPTVTSNSSVLGVPVSVSSPQFDINAALGIYCTRIGSTTPSGAAAGTFGQFEGWSSIFTNYSGGRIIHTFPPDQDVIVNGAVLSKADTPLTWTFNTYLGYGTFRITPFYWVNGGGELFYEITDTSGNQLTDQTTGIDHSMQTIVSMTIGGRRVSEWKWRNVTRNSGWIKGNSGPNLQIPGSYGQAFNHSDVIEIEPEWKGSTFNQSYPYQASVVLTIRREYKVIVSRTINSPGAKIHCVIPAEVSPKFISSKNPVSNSRRGFTLLGSEETSANLVGSAEVEADNSITISSFDVDANRKISIDTTAGSVNPGIDCTYTPESDVTIAEPVISHTSREIYMNNVPSSPNGWLYTPKYIPNVSVDTDKHLYPQVPGVSPLVLTSEIKSRITPALWSPKEDPNNLTPR